MADFSSQLPGILAEIARAAGPRAALRVAEARGGTRAYVPTVARLEEDHWLVAAAGMDAARKIAAELGGEHHDIPLGPTGSLSELHARIRRAVGQGREDGMTANQIARQAGVSRRTVFRHKKGDTGNDDQHSLF